MSADAYTLEELKLHVYLYLDAVPCSICGGDRIEELSVFWDGLGAGEANAMRFAERATEYLLEEGWTIHKELPCCADCHNRLKETSDSN